MRRGEIWRCDAHLRERGRKPGYYVIASRPFVAGSPQIATVLAAPIYSRSLGVLTEVLVGPENGLPHPSVVRCDFLACVVKDTLNRCVGQLSEAQTVALDEALRIALDLP